MLKYDDTTFRKKSVGIGRRIWRFVCLVSFTACVVHLFRFVDNLVYIRSDEARYALCAATGQSDFETTDRLRQKGVLLDVPCGYGTETPLILAALSGHADMAAYLLVWGANPNKPNRWGQTPLWVAEKQLALNQKFGANDWLSARRQSLQQLQLIRIIRLLKEAGAVETVRR